MYHHHKVHAPKECSASVSKPKMQVKSQLHTPSNKHLVAQPQKSSFSAALPFSHAIKTNTATTADNCQHPRHQILASNANVPSFAEAHIETRHPLHWLVCNAPTQVYQVKSVRMSAAQRMKHYIICCTSYGRGHLPPATCLPVQAIHVHRSGLCIQHNFAYDTTTQHNFACRSQL